MTKQHELEVKRGERFTFGDNWARFLRVLDDERIRVAEDSLKTMLGAESLSGKTFLDAGSGSGLFSLAARRLGAKVHSFDFDPQSVACTTELKRRYFPEDADWVVEEASVLDPAYLGKLGTFDVVYSWGVLHHTGQMWDALGNVAPLVAPSGKLFVAIYNDQGWVSKYWTFVKKTYNKALLAKFLLAMIHAPYLVLARWVVRTISRRGVLERGMAYWRDMDDWLGGYPFEVAKPEQIFRFYKDKEFNLLVMKTCGGRHGCNEFVFQK
jgi:2-polyprenyl-6-hydroxyphenyl methylase/3-demethylubiquinone-9 3-methyltransferase